MTITIWIVIAVILVLVLVFGLILGMPFRRFRANQDKKAKENQLNKDLESTGFGYERKGDYFYSLTDCWQREVGYCRLYDEGAPFCNMLIDCEPVTFTYGGKRWLIELWKGQYGITSGAQIGIYNTCRDDIKSEKFEGTFYENIRKEECMPMSYVLRKNGRVLLTRKAVHWWLTGFKTGEYSPPDSLTMDAEITFPNKNMCRAFIGGLESIGYQSHEYSVSGKKVKIYYSTPHTAQPITRSAFQEYILQLENENKCRLYELTTVKYGDTLDKLEHIKAAVPEVYQVFIKSLYARELYEDFEWIREITHGEHEKQEAADDLQESAELQPESCQTLCSCSRQEPSTIDGVDHDTGD